MAYSCGFKQVRWVTEMSKWINLCAHTRKENLQFIPREKNKVANKENGTERSRGEPIQATEEQDDDITTLQAFISTPSSSDKW